MRLALPFICLALVLALAGCEKSSDGDRSEADGQQAAMIIEGADAHIRVTLDYDGPQWNEIKQAYARFAQRNRGDGLPPTLDGAMNMLGQFVGISFTDDIKPVLGGQLQLMTKVIPAEPLTPQQREILDRVDTDRSYEEQAEATDPSSAEIWVDADGKRLPYTNEQVNAAQQARDERQPRITQWITYTTPDKPALTRLVDKLATLGIAPRQQGADTVLADGIIVRGATVMAVVNEDGDAPGNWKALLNQTVQRNVEALPDTFLVDVKLTPGIIGLAIDSEQLAAFRAIPQGKIEAANAALGLKDGGPVGNAYIRFGTDELPLGHPGPLELPEGRVASASWDQFHTTTYMAAVTRSLFPESRFITEIDELAKTGIDLEQDFLRQFVALSQTTTDENGEPFLSRSTVKDPLAMSKVLDQVQPAMPTLLNSLDGLGEQGLFALLLIAPDAPTTPGTPADFAPITKAPDAFYELTAPESLNAGRETTMTYGLRDNRFLVGSSPKLARTGELETVGRKTASSWTRIQPDVGDSLIEQPVDIVLTRKNRTIQVTIGPPTS